MAGNGGTVSPEEKIDSPPSLKGGKGALRSLSRSSSVSPLLDTAPLPSGALCPYCGQHFRKPRVLDCLHSMCEDCIIAQLDGKRDGDAARALAMATDCELEKTSQTRPTPPGVIRCPTCLQESHVGNDVRFVSHLLLDFVRLHEAESASVSSGTRSCRACKSEQPAVAVCKQCASDLCKNCVQAHRDMKLFDGHTVLTYSELAENPSQLPREPVMCITHPAMPYVLLCAACETLICEQCRPDHSDYLHHSLINVDDRIGELVKAELSEIASLATAKANATENACGCIAERQMALVNQYEVAHSQIEEAFADYARILEDAKERILKELDNARDEREADLHSLSHRVMVTANKIGDAVAFTGRLLEEGSPYEILASRKKVRQQLTSLSHSIPDMSTTVELLFNRSSHEQFEKQLNSIVGSVGCRLVSNALREDPALSSLRTFDSSVLKHLMTACTDTLPQSAGSGSESTRTTPAPIGSSQSSAFTAYASGPGTIGMERRQKSSTLSSHNSNADFSDGWPPSSVPPEPPSPSPPNDFSGRATGLGVAGSTDIGNSFYNWPPSSNPPPASETRIGSQTLLSQLPSANISSNISAVNSQQMPATVSNLLSMQKPNNLWMTQQAAGQLSGSGYPMPARQRSNPASLFEPLIDPTTLRLALTSLSAGIIDPNSLAALQTQLPPALGRQSQCGTPSEHLPQQAILSDRQFMPLNIPSVLRGPAPKNNASATDLTLRWNIGGLGTGPGQFGSPHGFCLGLDDEILVADTNNHRIQVLSKSGKVLVQFGLPGYEEGHLIYPKKAVALRPRGSLTEGGYIIVDKGDTKARLQLFSKTGEFIRRIFAPFIEYVSALTTNDNGHLVVFGSSSTMFVFDVEQTPAKVLKWADCSKVLEEPSDVSVYEGLYYVTDYKQHCIVVLNIEGDLVRKFGSFEHTPYPIGIDISKAGDVLIADSHGNHFHILACTKTGQKLQDFECTQIKVSRCVGLRITSEGLIVSISKHNHSVFLFNTLYLNH